MIPQVKVFKTMKKLIKMTQNDASQRHGERGNVLFLILIAVALFAALSYAVTSSSRSGGGDANDETNLVNSSTITQYPASVRTAIIRMQVSNGVAIDEIEFNKPGNNAADDGDYEDCSANSVCLFHPEGGGATFVPGPAEVMAAGTQTDWIFSSANEIDGLGVTIGGNGGDATSAEIVAFLPGISRGVCQRINEELGITSTSASGVPVESGVDFGFANSQVNDNGAAGPIGIHASGSGPTINGDDTDNELTGQAFGCFQQPAGTFVYYHALVEQ